MTRPLSVSVVVPVLNEAPRIHVALERLLAAAPDCEVVVVDGGSTDGTAEAVEQVAARDEQVSVLHTARGRARQMNAGAAATSADVVWFVHADTTVDPAALGQLRAVLADPRVVGGGLTLRFDRSTPALRYITWTSNLPARHLHWVFGDQAMFVRRSQFNAVGGFPDLPLMEDLEISRRLARRGRLVVLPSTSTASSRRFDEHGAWRLLLLMQQLKAMHLAGADADDIARRYSAGPRRRRRRLAPAHPKEPARARTW